MKYILILTALLSLPALALDVCSFAETADFRDALESVGINAHKISKDHKKFTFSEKRMIHLTVSTQSWLSGSSLEEALDIFGDFQDGRPGPNAGEIRYYKIEQKTLALVHYWPGDNEYGAFFEVKRDGSFKMLARVEDSWINCR